MNSHFINCITFLLILLNKILLVISSKDFVPSSYFSKYSTYDWNPMLPYQNHPPKVVIGYLTDYIKSDTPIDLYIR